MSEYKLRLSAVFLRLLLYIFPYHTFIDANSRYKVAYVITGVIYGMGLFLVFHLHNIAQDSGYFHPQAYACGISKVE